MTNKEAAKEAAMKEARNLIVNRKISKTNASELTGVSCCAINKSTWYKEWKEQQAKKK